MSSRYKVEGRWIRASRTFGRFGIEHADLRDTRSGTLYMSGAYRVVDTETGKPAKRGKGGTHPFKGETAWCDADRLAADMAMAERFAS